MTRFAEAIGRAGVDIVPRVMVGGGSNGANGSGSVFEALLTLMLSDRMGENVGGAIASTAARNPEAEALRNQIRQNLARSTQHTTTVLESAVQPVVPVTSELITTPLTNGTNGKATK